MSSPEPPYLTTEVEPRLARLRTRLNGVQAILRFAQALAENGEHVDLTGLDDQIGQLCAGALDLPQAAGRLFRPDIILLAMQVAALSAALRADPPGPS